MVITAKRLGLTLLVASFCGCSKGEFTFKEASTQFKAGMSQQQVEKTYGKPQIVDAYSGTTYWTYYPEHTIESGAQGQFSGFIVEFRDCKATKITEHVITKGSSSKPAQR
jgi:outer membrane protein assembly factor BamE (lipoprotein component of BamABCDE complex)